MQTSGVPWNWQLGARRDALLCALPTALILMYRIKDALTLTQSVQQVTTRCFYAIWIVTILKQHLLASFQNFRQFLER